MPLQGYRNIIFALCLPVLKLGRFSCYFGMAFGKISCTLYEGDSGLLVGDLAVACSRVCLHLVFLLGVGEGNMEGYSCSCPS